MRQCVLMKWLSDCPQAVFSEFKRGDELLTSIKNLIKEIVMPREMRFPVFVFVFALIFNLLGAATAQCNWETIYHYYLIGPRIKQYCQCAFWLDMLRGPSCGRSVSGFDWEYYGDITRVGYINQASWCNDCGNFNFSGFQAPYLGGCSPEPWPSSNDDYYGCSTTLFTQQKAIEVFVPEKKEDCCPDAENGQCCPIKQCPATKGGNPVDFISGAKEEKVTDLEFPTPFEQGFKIVRSYNSQYPKSFSMGYGWKHNYDISIQGALGTGGRLGPSIGELESTNGAIITVRGHQYNNNTLVDLAFISTESFGWQTFVSGENDFSHYTATDSDSSGSIVSSGGSWQWHRGNGTIYTFDQNNRFVTKTDGNGNTQALTYDAEGRLSTVTENATGRTIGFHYNADNLVDYLSGPVTDAVPDGIWVRYQYDTEGNLTRVEYADDTNGSDASGFQYNYTDTNDVHNLTEKRNLAGEFLSSWQYSADRVVSNITRDGKGVTLSYGTDSTVVTDANNVQTIYNYQTIDNQTYITSVTGGSGCTSCGGNAASYT